MFPKNLLPRAYLKPLRVSGTLKTKAASPPETSVPNYVFTAARIPNPSEIGFGNGNCCFSPSALFEFSIL